MGLFTGARAEEIASLDLEQVYPDKGIWIIDILDGKTENAVRKVPLHDQLLQQYRGQAKDCADKFRVNRKRREASDNKPCKDHEGQLNNQDC